MEYGPFPGRFAAIEGKYLFASKMNNGAYSIAAKKGYG